ncbi:DUF6360 family protein [Halococcus dombrowskii]|uniref:DUF6360 family protein n=1 Tax=Halococcus dombrowskii TaxID=179637 RepID=A0AAV3SJA0_HALDO|nr:DUF6360 family protein [Halococcus dombrowskii]UOO95324.1 DUF6360 family protein [Halococcus dombrowskii]
MSDRILKVNAYTTLDLLDGRAEGHGFEEDALAVLNVTADRKNPDAVKLQLELDNTDLDAVPAHADEIELTPEQARTVAAALEERAETVEDANDD